MKLLFILPAFCLFSGACAEHLLDDPFELKYVLAIGPKSEINLSFGANRKTARISRYGDIKPGYNSPIYNYFVPVTGEAGTDFFLSISGATVAGQFVKTAKVPMGENDQPFVSDMVQEYDLALTYAQEGTSVNYKGYCCGEYSIPPAPNN